MSTEVSAELEHYVTVTTAARPEQEYSVFFTATGDITYTPAYLGGSMEDGEPSDGECKNVKITAVQVFGFDDNDEKIGPLTDSDLVAACTAALDDDDVEDALWEAYHTEHG